MSKCKCEDVCVCTQVPSIFHSFEAICQVDYLKLRCASDKWHFMRPCVRITKEEEQQHDDASIRGLLRPNKWVCCLRAILVVDGGRVQRKYFRNAPFFLQCQRKLINLWHCRHHNLSIDWNRRLRKQENVVLACRPIFDLKCLRWDAVAASFLSYEHFDN